MTLPHKYEVLEYYNNHGTAYPSDVAEAFGINLWDAVKIVKELVREGKLEYTG
jgi:hypothetical protein